MRAPKPYELIFTAVIAACTKTELPPPPVEPPRSQLSASLDLARLTMAHATRIESDPYGSGDFELYETDIMAKDGSKYNLVLIDQPPFGNFGIEDRLGIRQFPKEGRRNMFVDKGFDGFGKELDWDEYAIQHTGERTYDHDFRMESKRIPHPAIIMRDYNTIVQSARVAFHEAQVAQRQAQLQHHQRR